MIRELSVMVANVAKSEEFVHYDIRTNFGTVGSVSRLEQMALAAKVMGHKTAGIADREIRSWILWEQECEKLGISPVFGWETDLALVLDRRPRRLTLMIEEETGFFEIKKLAKISRQQGGVDIDDLAAHRTGLIAVAPAETYPLVKDVFSPDRLFWEITNFGDEASTQKIKRSQELAAYFGARLIASNRVWCGSPIDNNVTISQMMRKKARQRDQPWPVRWVNDNGLEVLRNNHQAYELWQQLMAEKGYGKAVQPWHPEGWLKPSWMMNDLFPEFPDATAAGREVAARCKGRQVPMPQLPEYPVPEGTTPDEYVEKLVYEGLEEKYPAAEPGVAERFDRELTEIKKAGIASELLFARKAAMVGKGMEVGINGMGSVTDLASAYVLGITKVDPLKYGLDFERYLNEEMKKRADTDFNISVERRNEFVAGFQEELEQMGITSARIATFATIQERLAIRMIWSMFGYKRQKITEIQKLLEKQQPIPAEMEPLVYFARILYQRQLVWGEGTHGSKLVLYDPEKEDALMRTTDGKGNEVIEINKDIAEQEATLDFVGNTGKALIDRMEKRLGEKGQVQHEDKDTLAMIFRGETIGVPFLETRWLRGILIKVGAAAKHKDLRELDTVIAFGLSRPAARSSIDSYLRRRSGKEAYGFELPVLEKILGVTCGKIMFQEQTLAVADAVGGLTLAERNQLRRGVSKERGKFRIGSLKDKFIRNAQKKGMSRRGAIELFIQIEAFVKYGFPEGHVVSQVPEIAYICAYYKRHFPQEYFEEVWDMERNFYFWEHKPGVYLNEMVRLKLDRKKIMSRRQQKKS